MPDQSIIDAATQTLNNAANMMAQGNVNRKTRKWNEKMMDRQRQWAQEDWNKLNEYNHPSAQMARLREAGLNPNLVYGKGADVTADSVRGTETKAWNPKASQVSFDARSSMFANTDLAMKQAQVDNLRAQNTVLDQEAQLKKAQTLNTLTGEEMTRFSLGQERTLAENSIEFRKQQLKKLQADTAYTVNSDERAAIMQSQNITESVERILTMRVGRNLTSSQIGKVNQEIRNLKLDEKLKQQDLDLWKDGITKADPLYMRIIAAWADRILKMIEGAAGSPEGSTKPMLKSWPFKIPIFK